MNKEKTKTSKKALNSNTASFALTDQNMHTKAMLRISFITQQ